MLKTILAVAATALVVASIAPPAHAGTGVNGIRVNGITKNGVLKNGVLKNGVLKNGSGLQGTSTDAISFTIDGIELPTAR